MRRTRPPTATPASVAERLAEQWGMARETMHAVRDACARLLAGERRYTREVLEYEAENHDSDTSRSMRDSVLYKLSPRGRAWLAKCARWERDRRAAPSAPRGRRD